ncbi:hypothetical protein CKA32_001733 [Geitlerinema sp. FC II]|nr:hypothetical protein CKA32_001733 [Geitlerinema sp. FC II]
MGNGEQGFSHQSPVTSHQSPVKTGNGEQGFLISSSHHLIISY